jgi:hypothetical protein
VVQVIIVRVLDANAIEQAVIYGGASSFSQQRRGVKAVSWYGR